MAITSLHRSMTHEILMEEFKFAEAPASAVADANASVDDSENQGSSEDLTKLHAMVGEDSAGHLVDVEVTKSDVTKLLADRKADVVAAVTKKQRDLARTRLGQALHTIQDRAFHNFEPWPYHGIAAALTNDPNYMVCHAVRDLGFVSLLDLQAANSSARLAVELTWRLPPSNDIFWSVQGFTDFGTGPPRWAGPPGPTGMEPLGSGGMILLSWGAPPGSLRAPYQERERPYLADNPNRRMLTEGPGARARARKDTIAYIEEVRGEVIGQAGDAGWNDLRLIPPAGAKAAQ